MVILATKQPIYSRYDWMSTRDFIPGKDDGEEKRPAHEYDDGWIYDEIDDGLEEWEVGTDLPDNIF